MSHSGIFKGEVIKCWNAQHKITSMAMLNAMIARTGKTIPAIIEAQLGAAASQSMRSNPSEPLFSDASDGRELSGSLLGRSAFSAIIFILGTSS
jgi:hypothetical protein